ncbi:MAG: FecR domain-containing protein [Woeseia sp.]
MNRYRRDAIASVPQQAAEWLVELAEPGLGENCRRQFMNWLKKSPQHIEEFLAIAVLQQEVAEQSSAIADIIADLRTANDRSAVPLFDGPGTAAASPGFVRRRRHYLLWASAAGLVIAALFLVRYPGVEGPVISHSTALGEQRSIALNDGSIVMLNTLSELTVHFDDSIRQVTLVAGEVMFDVVADPQRPFVVETGTLSLNVLGTKFSVYRKQNSTRVAVVDGVVRAVSRRSPDAPLLVRAGEGAVITEEGVTLTDPLFDLQKAIAWTERRLVFDAAPLAEVVAEFNRYNRTPLIVEDRALANRAITTVFNAHDVSALVGFLELQPDVEVQHGEDAIRIRVKR